MPDIPVPPADVHETNGNGKPKELKSDGAHEAPRDPDVLTFVMQYNRRTQDCNVQGEIFAGMDMWYAAVGIATDKVKKMNELNRGYCRAEKNPSYKKPGGFFGKRRD